MNRLPASRVPWWALAMDAEAVLRTYDLQLRQHPVEDGTGWAELTGRAVRWIAHDRQGWSGVVWSRLTEADADAEIAAQRERFTGLGRRFEWKHYAYDTPGDLPGRLRSAGFHDESAEALMVAAVAELSTQVQLPPGVRLERVTDAASIEAFARVGAEAFGDDRPGLIHSLTTQLSGPAGTAAAAVLWAGDRPVSAGRLELPSGVDFASVWGGGTVVDWRRRGLYRALVAWRAGIAAARGYRYLQVDATPASEPILRRLGFVRLTTTTPYVYQAAVG